MEFIDKIKATLLGKGIERQTAESRDWLRENIRKANEAKGASMARKLENDYKNFRVLPRVGEMIMFVYDPKHKLTLPYYDEFPLIFVVDADQLGFLGINLHYLSPKMRMELYAALLKLATNNKYNDRMKLKLSWQILKAFTAHKLVRPTVKRYLWGNVRSNFVRVLPDDWEITVFLPTERFQKEHKRTVWAKSRVIANK